MSRPYTEKSLNENIVIRKFPKKVAQAELVWHRDHENRIIEVISGEGWKFQRDNSLPRILSEGDRIYVNAGEYHRLLKGRDDLYVKIYKEGKKRKKKKKPFPDLTGDGKVTRADILKARGVFEEESIDEKTKSKKKKKSEKKKDSQDSHGEYIAKNYGAPKNSPRAKHLKQSAKAYEKNPNDPNLYARREKEEKKYRKKTVTESSMLSRQELRKILLEVYEEILDEKRRRKRRKKRITRS